MKAPELMISDFIAVNKTPIRIAALGTAKAGFLDARGEMFYHYYDNIEPIPLTAEILEKNGFKKKKYSNLETLFYGEFKNYDFIYVRSFGCPEFEIGNSFDEEGELQEFTTIKYVHELQHALKLCGIEKEIRTLNIGETKRLTKSRKSRKN